MRSERNGYTRTCSGCGAHVNELFYFEGHQGVCKECHERFHTPSMVQCEYDDPSVVSKIIDAIDELDDRLRKLEEKT